MNPLLKECLQQIQNLNSEEVFLVKDLFRGYEWNRIDRTARLNLGILFKNEVLQRPELGIEMLDKTSSDQQKYRKK